MAGRKPWKCTEEDKDYVCNWILKTFGEDERRTSLQELNNIIESFMPNDLETLKGALRQHRRRRAMSGDMLKKPKTVELQSHVYEALTKAKLEGETYSHAIARLVKNVTQ